MKQIKNNFLKDFVQLYSDYAALKENENHSIADIETQRYFYQQYQPTGLLYGAPVVTGFIGDNEKYNSMEDSQKLKFVFLSAIFNFHERAGNGNPMELIYKLAEFYSTIYYNDQAGFDKKLEEDLKIKNAEKILRKRILKSRTLRRYFSFHSSHNCLLFLDVFFFIHWMQKLHLNTEKVKKEMHQLYFTVLKVVAAAMWANNSLERSEKYIYRSFIHSTQFNRDQRKAARKLLKQKIDLDSIDVSEVESWILKKYLLELAIFTIYSDRMIEHNEKSFLQRLSKKLGLDNDEFDASFIAVETFMLENWENIRVLKYKSHAGMVYGDLKNKMMSIGKRYKTSFVTEIKESRELMKLINKSRREDLTEEERKKVKAQLVDIMKTIPALSVTLLPGGTVILFALYEILPDEFLPSGFKNKIKDNLPKK